MAKVMFVSPRKDMQDLAVETVADAHLPHCGEIIFRTVDGVNIENAVAQAKRENVSLVVARGKQAVLLKEQLACPIVEIRLSGHELALLVEKAKKLTGKERPIVSVMGIHNMYSDVSQFGKLLNVEIHYYSIDEVTDLTSALEAARTVDKADVIIGGTIACKFAEDNGIIFLFAESGREGILTALNQAELLATVIDNEQKNNAQTRALLDYSFNGIIQLDDAGIVITLNQVAEALLNLRPNAALGMTISHIWPEMDDGMLGEAECGKKELYSRIVQYKNKTFLVNLVPVTANERITSIMLTFQESTTLIQMETNLRQALYQHGHTAALNFSSLDYIQSAKMKQTIAMARLYAKSEAPMLISGEPGTGTQHFAQAIHNESRRSSQPFVVFHCGCVESKDCSAVLFGSTSGEGNTPNHGAIAQANEGTLLLEDIEYLSADAQRRLQHFMQTGVAVPCGTFAPQRLNVRIIAVTSKDIAHYVEDGSFSSALYYALDVLSLTILPLRQRREDIEPLFNNYITEYSKRYRRYISLSNAAKQVMIRYPWPGNIPQLQSFCERLLITSPHRSVSEDYINHLLATAYPIAVHHKDAQLQMLSTPEAVTIVRLMAKYAGNREKIAREMGISKTTLWRKMKAAGIQNGANLD